MYVEKNRYKLNVIVDDGSGVVNFTIFERLAHDLVRIPAQNLVAIVNSDKFTLPSIINTITNRSHIFQMMTDAQKFTTNIP